jgi:hypothetical protein
MNYRALMGAAAIISTSFAPIATTAAWADDGDGIILTPLTESDETPQQVCDDVLRPAAPSGFLTAPVNVSDGGWVNTGAPYFDPSTDTGPAGPASGYGTPVPSNVFLSNSYFRNGGSPNVWALAQATLTYPQTQQAWNLLQDQTDTITFGCHVWKVVPGNGNIIEPPGLQTTGNATIGHRTIGAGVGNKITDDDFIITGATVAALICISPGTKGGKWTGKNGFNASNCAAASTAAGGTIPSGNIPQI